jgi:hypothetical protein
MKFMISRTKFPDERFHEENDFFIAMSNLLFHCAKLMSFKKIIKTT